MGIQNEFFDQEYLTQVEINGEMYHARYVGEDIKVVVYQSTGQPVPVWVCICDAETIEYCVCGAWEFHTNRTKGGLLVWSKDVIQ